ncbi:MAG: hypothetical protein AAGN66_06830 [Acidobacteriota bacterium]
MRRRRWIAAAGTAALLGLLAACGGAPETAEDVAAGPSPASPGAELTNRLKWSTGGEEDNLGFYVYRSESPQGPFVRVNDERIPGAGTTDRQRDYEYLDGTIASGVEYHYYVESERSDGSTAQVTPVIRAPAKFPSSADTATADSAAAEDGTSDRDDGGAAEIPDP